MSEPGTPNAAVEEALKTPQPIIVDLDQHAKGERWRTSGLLLPLPDDLGGGHLRIRPGTVDRVRTAQELYEAELRKHPKVKKAFKPTEPLRNKPGTDLNRHICLMAICEWITEAKFKKGEEILSPAQMDEVDLRKFIKQHFLPPLDLDSEEPPEVELNATFFAMVLEGVEEVSNVSALAIAAVGKDFTLGRVENVDYSG